MTDLGRLERVDLRTIWTTESRHFTPWLAQQDNLQLLGEAIGIELELEAQEKSVGLFRADILCKDTLTDNWVLIENQLERTDHTHLGQLITYAAGLQAAIIVWIANPFTEEHRAALDWLNQITDSRFNFFGLEVELWRIGDSRTAPKFNVVCKPNDWSKTVAEGVAQVDKGELSPGKQIQFKFWQSFCDYVSFQKTSLNPRKPSPKPSMGFSIGRSGCGLSAIASFWDNENQSYESNEIRVAIRLNDGNSKTYFRLLEQQREFIENELGYGLLWYNPESIKRSQIYVRKTVNLEDESDWLNQHEWLVKRLEEFHHVFAPRIQALIP